MAITIDWPSKVINIPKADLTLIQASPTEIRELDLNNFRLELKGIEASEGIPFLDTHLHYAPVTVGGVTLARVVQIINNYTVTFEDGQYAVNLTGANSNVADVTNVNQVSVRSANSAGLIQTSEIEFSSFEGAVHVDPNASTTGTLYPSGTALAPVNNLSDALLISNLRGFVRMVLYDDMTIDSGGMYDGLEFVGRTENVSITIGADASVIGCIFRDMTITGTLDGDSKLIECIIDDLTFVNGLILRCGLRGNITLGGGLPAILVNCYDAVAGLGVATIDMNGSGQSLVVRNYNGGLQIKNKTGNDGCSLEVDPGRIVLDATVGGAETILIRGVGKLVNNGATAPIDTNELLSLSTIAASISGSSSEKLQGSI